LAFQALPGYHTVVVASTSTLQDEQIKETLRTAGTTVIDTYVPNVEDIYHLSDLYLFLAEQDTAAIEMPLSVLEAMACNLPVICTPFGGLPDFFAAGDGLFYWDGQAKLADLIITALSRPATTRALVEPYTWAAAAQTLMHLLTGAPSPKPWRDAVAASSKRCPAPERPLPAGRVHRRRRLNRAAR
jgi:glycosyltransferase involved in cell wall biosynthesis